MPIAALAPSLIGAGASLIGGFLGSKGSKSAAATQAAAGQAVAGSINKATGQAIDAGYAGIGQANDAIAKGTTAADQYIGGAGTTQAGLYGNMTAGLQPYPAAGTYGLNQLAANAGTFRAPTAEEAAATPGYQFQLQQGTQALQSAMAARGMLQSGATLKSLNSFGQGLAGTTYQQTYNNALNTYNANQAGYQSLASLGQNANSQNIQAGSIYGGQLTSLAGLGTSAAMQGAGLGANVAMQGNEYVGNVGLQGAEAAGRAILGSADATAAGQMGSANAWSGAVGGVANAANGYAAGTNSAANTKYLNTLAATGGVQNMQYEPDAWASGVG